MACNFLKPRAPENLKESDTMSTISETTNNSDGSSNWASSEDLRNYITRMGYKHVSDLYQERFRVDRKKLEQMLTGHHEAPLPADIFFEQIMADTNTFITWPSKLKIDAKSKKDPHVRVAGKSEDVNAAKERIMTALDTRSNRVTMKMDVSYVHHSHIIGRGGLTIKQIMEETQCHVHFPDSNRTSALEKSNQVSIAGEIQSAEAARSRVRHITPVIFGFELPTVSPVVDLHSAYIINIQEQYNVEIRLKTRQKLHATLVLVKGTEWHVEQAKKATILLIEHLCGDVANRTSVEMSLEISTHHHGMVTGPNHSNLKDIVRVTGAKILYPDVEDPNLPMLKKSTVTIVGNIHSVYMARQLLLGSLPLLVMFDLPKTAAALCINSRFINSIQSQFDVNINIRRKAGQDTMVCSIKAPEKHASNIYKARNMILAIDEPSIMADIPANYHLPSVPPTLPPLQLSVHPQPLTPLISPLISPMWHLAEEPLSQNGPSFVMPQHPFVYNQLHSAASSGYQSMGQLSQYSQTQSQPNSPYSSMLSTPASSSPILNSSDLSPSCHQHNFQDQPDKTEVPSIFKEMNNPGFHSPTFNKPRGAQPSTISDYEQKRIAGYKAMQARPTGLRYPNNSWSGYGISNTCPTAVIPDRTQLNNNDAWKSSTTRQILDFPSSVSSCSGGDCLNSSDPVDHTPNHLLSMLTSTNWPDLTTLFTSLELQKYLSVFSSHEIDLATFSSMTEKDLMEVGVTAFGARRKMLLAIAELKKREQPFALAPGAERKSLSSSPCISRTKR